MENPDGRPVGNSWTSTYTVQRVTEDQIVLKLVSAKSKFSRHTPVILDLKKSGQSAFRMVNPRSLPVFDTYLSDNLSTWVYEGSTENYHIYFRGYGQRLNKSSKGEDICHNHFALVDDEAKAVKTYRIEMLLPGYVAIDYNMMSGVEGRNTNFIDDKYEKCIYMFALAKKADDPKSIAWIAKKVSYEGKILWETATSMEVDKNTMHVQKPVLVKYDYDGSPILLIPDAFSSTATQECIYYDKATGKGLVGKYNDPTLDASPRLGRGVQSELAKIKKSNPDMRTLLAAYLDSQTNTYYLNMDGKNNTVQTFKAVIVK
jgi:hypothetical protein